MHTHIPATYTSSADLSADFQVHAVEAKIIQTVQSLSAATTNITKTTTHDDQRETPPTGCSAASD